MSRERSLAGLGLALVLLVVVAAAGIRLEIGIPGLRVVHRLAASLEVVVVLRLAWIAPRRPAVWMALGLTGLLALVGIVAGQQPPPAAAATNLLGGLALAATFAWILGGRMPGSFSGRRTLTPFLAVVLALQVSLGAWLSIVERFGPLLPAHAMLALVLTALLVWHARRKALVVLALAAPLAGFTSLHYEYSALAALAHAAAAVSLVVFFVWACATGLTHIKGTPRPY
jgi:hypothetical protein